MTAIINLKKMRKKNVSGAKTQEYDILFKEGNFEIRYYPAAVMASVNMQGTYDRMKKNGFNMLAGYIFGGNSESKKISMTTPVHVKEGEEEGRMSFVMPSELNLDNLPKPDSKNVFLHKSEPAYLVSLQFGGFSNDRKITSKKEKLKQLLAKKGINHTNKSEYLGYSSPYKMMNRRNEVIFYIDEADVKKFMSAE